jgi:hypothetical protein
MRLPDRGRARAAHARLASSLRGRKAGRQVGEVRLANAG